MIPLATDGATGALSGLAVDHYVADGAFRGVIGRLYVHVVDERNIPNAVFAESRSDRFVSRLDSARDGEWPATLLGLD